MEIISHRRNQISELQATEKRFGIEVDIRSQGQSLVIHHDPFASGVNFEEWIESFNHGTLILNVKEEGLESRLLEIMARNKISNFFFLDQSFPFLIKTSRTGESRCAVRVSEFESISTALTLAGKVNWVWLDHFTKFPLDLESFQKLRQAGFKVCLVSPELQGFPADNAIPDLIRYLKSNRIEAQAVCTKRPDLWERFLAES